MTIVIPHKMTEQEAIAKVDRSAGELFNPGGPVEITNQKKSWNGSRMDFSMTAGVGFISVPVSGFVAVDPVNVTIDVDLPPMAKNFIGEDKIRANVENKVRGLLSA